MGNCFGRARVVPKSQSGRGKGWREAWTADSESTSTHRAASADNVKNGNFVRATRAKSAQSLFIEIPRIPGNRRRASTPSTTPSKLGSELGLNKGIDMASNPVSVSKENSDNLLHKISSTEIVRRNNLSEQEIESSVPKTSSDDENSITQSDTLMPENHGSSSILNKYMPKISEKGIRGKVANLLASWDVSGKLAELESSVESVSIASTISISQLAAALKQDTLIDISMESQVAVAYKIYCWVSKNISYIDGTKSKDASDVLKTKKAVCHGYTILYQALANEVGLKVVRVSGNTRKWLSHPETHFKPNNNNSHTWNLVRHFTVVAISA